jgi:hypothetical protein
LALSPARQFGGSSFSFEIVTSCTAVTGEVRHIEIRVSPVCGCCTGRNARGRRPSRPPAPDATYRPHREHCCKHCTALREAYQWLEEQQAREAAAAQYAGDPPF